MRVIVHDEVRDALASGAPVVALESAVTTMGLPRTALGRVPVGVDDPDWDAASPINLETARLTARCVRAAGAVPATIVVSEGVVHVGIDDATLQRIAWNDDAGKTSSGDLAWSVVRGRTAGTTVSATLHIAARLAPSPIRVFATGGIGGVHRGWTRLPDVSADLDALAAHAVCTVCAGAKSILDLPATVEALETRGVPIVGYGTTRFPRFYASGSDDLTLEVSVDDAAGCAEICRMQWETLRLERGVLLVQDPPEAVAMDGDMLEREIDAAERAAEEGGVAGRERTPFVLASLAEVTEGKSLAANVALLAANARLAGELAVALA